MDPKPQETEAEPEIAVTRRRPTLSPEEEATREAAALVKNDPIDRALARRSARRDRAELARNAARPAAAASAAREQARRDSKKIAGEAPKPIPAAIAAPKAPGPEIAPKPAASAPAVTAQGPESPSSAWAPQRSQPAPEAAEKPAEKPAEKAAEKPAKPAEPPRKVQPPQNQPTKPGKAQKK